MRRIAFFVEGAAEMFFVERLVSEVADAKNVIITKKKIRGGGKSGKVPKRVVEVDAARDATNEQFYVLIYDCGGDHQVAQRIKQEHQNLTDSGYERIIGVRDVRPDFGRDEIQALEHGMLSVVDRSLAPVLFILSVMEVESWFLAEYNHFEKMHPGLTFDLIVSSVGFDPRITLLSNRDNPAQDLEAIYGLQGVPYEKTNVMPTINSLDYAFMYSELVNVIPELGRLSVAIDEFLTPNA